MPSFLEQACVTVGHPSVSTTTPKKEPWHFSAEAYLNDNGGNLPEKTFPSLFPRQVEKPCVFEDLNENDLSLISEELIENDLSITCSSSISVKHVISNHIIYANKSLTLEDQKVCEAILEKMSTSTTDLDFTRALKDSCRSFLTSAIIGLVTWCSIMVWAGPLLIASPSVPRSEKAKARCNRGERFTSGSHEGNSAVAFFLSYISIYGASALGHGLMLNLVPNRGESQLPRILSFLLLGITGLGVGIFLGLFRDTLPSIRFVMPALLLLSCCIANVWIGQARSVEYAFTTKTCLGSLKFFCIIFVGAGSSLFLTNVIFVIEGSLPETGLASLGVSLVPVIACRVFDSMAKDVLAKCHNMPVSWAATWTLQLQLGVVTSFRIKTMENNTSMMEVLVATLALILVEVSGRCLIAFCLADACRDTMESIVHGACDFNEKHWTYEYRRKLRTFSFVGFCCGKEPGQVDLRLKSLRRRIRIFELDIGADVLVEYVSIWTLLGLLLLANENPVAFVGPPGVSLSSVLLMNLMQLGGEFISDAASSLVVHRASIANAGELFSSHYGLALSSILALCIANAALVSNVNRECLVCNSYDEQSCQP